MTDVGGARFARHWFGTADICCTGVVERRDIARHDVVTTACYLLRNSGSAQPVTSLTVTGNVFMNNAYGRNVNLLCDAVNADVWLTTCGEHLAWMR